MGLIIMPSSNSVLIAEMWTDIASNVTAEHPFKTPLPDKPFDQSALLIVTVKRRSFGETNLRIIYF